MAANSKRIAAFDIGTVTCRLLLAEVQDGVLHELERRCVITNLGVGVDKTGVLQEDAIQRVVAQIGEYIEIVNSYRTEQQPEIPIVAVATSAFARCEEFRRFGGEVARFGRRAFRYRRRTRGGSFVSWRFARARRRKPSGCRYRWRLHRGGAGRWR